MARAASGWLGEAAGVAPGRELLHAGRDRARRRGGAHGARARRLVLLEQRAAGGHRPRPQRRPRPPGLLDAARGRRLRGVRARLARHARALGEAAPRRRARAARGYARRRRQRERQPALARDPGRAVPGQRDAEARRAALPGAGAGRARGEDPLRPAGARPGDARARSWWGSVLVLVEPDLGSSLFVVAEAVVLLGLAGIRPARLAPLATVALPALVAVAWAKFPHVQRRWDLWTQGAETVGGQVQESLVAIGSGGALRPGPGPRHAEALLRAGVQHRLHRRRAGRGARASSAAPR